LDGSKKKKKKKKKEEERKKERRRKKERSQDMKGEGVEGVKFSVVFVLLLA